MDLATAFVAIAVFGVLYQGVGLLLNRRRPSRHAWDTARPAEAKWMDRLADAAAQFGPNRWLLGRKAYREASDNLLLRSGNPFGWSAESLLLYKEFSIVFVLIPLSQSEFQHPAVLFVGAIIGFKALDFYLTMKATARREDIQRQLPGFVNLLALTMESGLDLVAATERIVEKMKPNALRSELQSLIQENRLGTARKVALSHLAFRTNLPDMQSLTSLIIQSEELGTSLAAVLRSYAEDMRSKRILRAEDIAGKAPVKLLFPMMIFFFPIVFVVIFGPLALSFMKGYK